MSIKESAVSQDNTKITLIHAVAYKLVATNEKPLLAQPGPVMQSQTTSRGTFPIMVFKKTVPPVISTVAQNFTKQHNAFMLVSKQTDLSKHPTCETNPG